MVYPCGYHQTPLKDTIKVTRENDAGRGGSIIPPP